MMMRSTRIRLILVICLTIFAGESHAVEVLFIAGPKSHAPGEHEFVAGCEILAAGLNGGGLPLHATVRQGWPADEELARADTLVLYGDGLGDHVAREHVAGLRRHVAAGKGLVVLHFALEPAPGDLADLLLATVGGRFEADRSVNPVWTPAAPVLAQHPVTSGVPPFTLADEWYYFLRFRPGATPLLQALPSLASLGADGPRTGNAAVRAALARGEPQTLAWVTETGGARAFGFTGGHFHRNWADDSFRRLVLNGIAWTAGVAIPADGIASAAPVIPHHASIDEAIARGDLDDVKRHLALDPTRIRRGQNPALTPLQQAILRGRTEIALHLLDVGADVNAADSSGRTPLHLAVLRNHPALITTLLTRQARPDVRDRQGWTPLHHAAARDRIAATQALLAGGADPMTLSELGGTPLHEAAASGSAAMIRLLLASGIDPAIVSKTGATALSIAREYKNEAAVTVLLETGLAAKSGKKFHESPN